MIEIAIALAVIGFALVAIIGVLPTGITVQKDNREDTIINQDGPYWMEAIRSGNRGLDFLTNFVESVTVTNSKGGYTNISPTDPPFTGSQIVNLLSYPKYFEDASGNIVTNTVTARVRALSGAATEQGTNNVDFAFAYQMRSEITPFQQMVTKDSTNFTETGLTDAQIAQRRVAWTEVVTRDLNTTEIRLVFRWPLLSKEETGPNRQIFRSIVSGVRVYDTNFDGWFFQPSSFVPQIPPP